MMKDRRVMNIGRVGGLRVMKTLISRKSVLSKQGIHLLLMRLQQSMKRIFASMSGSSTRCSTGISMFFHRLIYRRNGINTGVLTSEAQTQRLASGLQLTMMETGFSLTNTTNRARRLIITLGSFNPNHKIYKIGR